MSRNAQSFIADRCEHPAPTGAIVFMTMGPEKKVAGFSHACPCGCGKWSFIRLNPENWTPGTKPMWTRQGDDERMTLAPSIGVHPIEQGKYHWHGYLRDGVFVEE